MWKGTEQNKHLAGGVVANLGEVSVRRQRPFVMSQRAVAYRVALTLGWIVFIWKKTI